MEFGIPHESQAALALDKSVLLLQCSKIIEGANTHFKVFRMKSISSISETWFFSAINTSNQSFHYFKELAFFMF